MTTLFTSLPSYSDVEGIVPGIGSFRFQTSTIGGLIAYFLPIIFVIAGLILLVFLIVGGFKFLTSSGDPKAMSSAQKIIMNALIGFLIVIASFWIFQILSTVFQLGEANLPSADCKSICSKAGYNADDSGCGENCGGTANFGPTEDCAEYNAATGENTVCCCWTN